MKKRFYLIRRGGRGGAYYVLDSLTNKRESLGTKIPDEAERLVQVRNEAVRHAEMNLQIAQIYLRDSDSTLATRTWQEVIRTALSSHAASWLRRSNSTVANHFRAFCAGLPKGFRCPALINN